MEESIEIIVQNCLLSKLSKEYHEHSDHPEFRVRNKTLKECFPKLLSYLEREDCLEYSDIQLAHLINLYLELKTEGSWNTEEIHSKEYSESLNMKFKTKHNMDLMEILYSDGFNHQKIFDLCIMELHKRMTIDEFKRYPSLIEVYCLLVKNVKDYKINLNAITVLPVALLLIEDYVPANKIKGLQSCKAILQCLTTEDFTTGNYYEVIYSSLKKNIVEKDKEVTQVLFECVMEFLNLLPSNIKKIKLDDIFSSIIDQLHTETNLYRKVDFFNFTTKIIEMHGIHCVKKKLFKDIIYDNLDICSNESVDDILLPHVLECLQTWVRHCWCVWKLTADQKMLSSLFKILYLAKDETIKLEIQNLIITLIKLCSKEEQTDILEDLEAPFIVKNVDFVSRIDSIKKQINIYLITFIYKFSNIKIYFTLILYTYII